MPPSVLAGASAGFSAARVQEHFGRLVPKAGGGSDAPQFLAAVLGCVTSEMLQRAGDVAAASSSGRIEPQHIRTAVEQDKELSSLVGEEAMAEGGLLGSVLDAAPEAPGGDAYGAEDANGKAD